MPHKKARKMLRSGVTHIVAIVKLRLLNNLTYLFTFPVYQRAKRCKRGHPTPCVICVCYGPCCL